MKPYYDDGKGIQIFHCDCREILPHLPKVDLVLTDPPYGVNIAAWDNEMPPQSILDECLRVSTGTVAWFGAATRVLDFAKYDPTPDRMLVWNPSFALGRCQSRGFVYSWHPIALWRPSQCGGFSLDVLRHSADGHNWWNHPGTKPIGLMTTLCEMLSNATILDPFMGSGTTLVAARSLGRQAIGIEIEERYCAIAVQRLAQTVMRFDEPMPTRPEQMVAEL